MWGVAAALAVGALVVATIGYTLGQQSQTALSSGGTDAVRTADVTADGSMSYGGVAPQAVAPSGDQLKSVASPETAAQPTASGDKLIIRNAAMEVRVKAVDAALRDLKTAVRRADGEVTDLTMSAGDSMPVPLADGTASSAQGPSNAFATIRVPAANLDSLIDDVAALGVVVTQSASASDVTEQAIDLDARLKTLRAEELRLRSFLRQTNKVSDLLLVERELARVRGEIESMDAQLTYLKRQAARATLTVTLSEPGPVIEPSGPTWGLREALTRGIQAAASVITTLITVSIPLALIAVLVAVIALPVRALMRRRAARHTRNEESETE